MVEYEDIDFGGMWRFQYDALGRRVSRSSPSGFTAYVNGGQASWQVLAEFDGVTEGANLVATYIYGNYIDEPIQMSRDFDGDGAGSVQHFYYHQDDLFNVIALTAGVGGSTVPAQSPFAAGVVVERVRYGDYGSPEFINAAGTALAFESIARNPYLFTGREWDDGIRFYHYRTRYMEPTWGRFTTRDSIGTWGDAENLGNGVAFVATAPLMKIDPYGQTGIIPYDPKTFRLPGHWVPGPPISSRGQKLGCSITCKARYPKDPGYQIYTFIDTRNGRVFKVCVCDGDAKRKNNQCSEARHTELNRLARFGHSVYT